jgi:hypothetical protein
MLTMKQSKGEAKFTRQNSSAKSLIASAWPNHMTFGLLEGRFRGWRKHERGHILQIFFRTTQAGGIGSALPRYDRDWCTSSTLRQILNIFIVILMNWQIASVSGPTSTVLLQSLGGQFWVLYQTFGRSRKFIYLLHWPCANSFYFGAISRMNSL